MRTTRAMIEMLGQFRGDTAERLFFAALALTLLPLTVLIDCGLNMWRKHRLEDWAKVQAVHCPKGHVIPVIGAWTCSSCGLTWEGSGLLPCIFCGETSFIQCSCGLSVATPFLNEEE